LENNEEEVEDVHTTGKNEHIFHTTYKRKNIGHGSSVEEGSPF